jgi:hypothetical protein
VSGELLDVGCFSGLFLEHAPRSRLFRRRRRAQPRRASLRYSLSQI